MRKSWIVAFLVTIFLSINHSLPADFGVKQQISVDPASAGFPRQLDVDGSGRALLVWLEGTKDIKSSTFDGSVWSEPETLFSEDQGLSNLAVSKSLCGDKAALSYVTGNNELKAATSEDGFWSSLSLLLESDAQPFNGLDMTVEGEALNLGVVDNAGSSVSVYSSFFTGSSWDDAIDVKMFAPNAAVLSNQPVSTGDYPLREPKTYAVWFNNNDIVFGIWDEDAKTWSVDEDSTPPPPWSQIDKINPGYVAANGLGQVLVGWVDDSKRRIRGDYFDGTSWYGASWLSNSLGVAIQHFSVGMSEDGVGYALASTIDGNSSGKVVAVVRNTNGTLAEELLDEANSSYRFGGSSLAVHPDGTALAAWVVKPNNSIDDYRLYYSKYTPGSGWSYKKTFVELGASDFALNVPRAAISRNGIAVVAWHDLKGTNGDVKQQVFATVDPEFAEPTIPFTPENLTGTKFKNSFPTEAEYFNAIVWDAPCDPVIVSYNVYRGTDKIANILVGEDLCFFDHNREKRETVTYTVTAVNGKGIESEPATFTLECNKKK